MSDSEEDFAYRYYQCTCCGMRTDNEPVKCGCHDEYCRVCHRCRNCCKAPGVHFRTEYLARSMAIQEDFNGFLSRSHELNKRTIDERLNQARRVRRGLVTRTPLNAEDVTWLLDLRIKVEVDIDSPEGL